MPVDLHVPEALLKTPIESFATPEDIALCRRIHKRFGGTYYFASSFFPAEIRDRVHVLYAFVRLADEWVDNPQRGEDATSKLSQYRRELMRGIDGVAPQEPVLRAFCDLVRECNIPLEEPLAFLASMELDTGPVRYETFKDLRRYMRGSASAVGVMMCHVLGAPGDDQTLASARALGEAMQLTNFIRDVAEDSDRGRIYLPLEDMRRFSVSEQDVLRGKMSGEMAALIQFQIRRARSLYAAADEAIDRLPDDVRKPVRIARLLYARILNRVEQNRCDVFKARAKTFWWEKLAVAAHVALGG